jgi:hypothetical protein
MFPGIGGLFSLVSNVVGIGFQMAGQKQAEQAAEAKFAAEATAATFKSQIQAQQYQLYNTMQRRMQTQTLRTSQAAQAQSFGTLENQAGSGAQFSSAAGGARGQISGEESTALSGVSENLDTAKNIYGLNQQIDMQQIAAAMAGSREAQAAGTMAMGGDIAKIGSAFGSFLGGPNASIFSGLGGGGGGSSVGTGNDLFAGVGMPA